MRRRGEVVGGWQDPAASGFSLKWALSMAGAGGGLNTSCWGCEWEQAGGVHVLLSSSHSLPQPRWDICREEDFCLHPCCRQRALRVSSKSRGVCALRRGALLCVEVGEGQRLRTDEVVMKTWREQGCKSLRYLPREQWLQSAVHTCR